MNDAQLKFDAALENIYPETEGGADLECSKNSPSPAGTFFIQDGGSGKEAEILFQNAKTVHVKSRKDSKTQEHLTLTYDLSGVDGAAAVQRLVAEENSRLTVVIESKSDRNSGGLFALRTEIYAAPYSEVHVVKVQTLSDIFTHVDDTKIFADDGASVEITHVILGSAKTFMGLAADLKGYRSSFHSDMGYFCRNGQEFDMNCLVNHFGKKTSSEMLVFGSLEGNAKKTYRGTIDLKNGAKGAVGVEQEDVLLLSENAVNNSIPVILCTEEDVAGEHGATIGRLGDEVLFYMESRGIGQKAAENLMARAKVQRVANRIPEGRTKEETDAFMDELFGVD